MVILRVGQVMVAVVSLAVASSVAIAVGETLVVIVGALLDAADVVAAIKN